MESMAERPEDPQRALADAIRHHRICFEVERETDRRDDQRITVALRVWLWASIRSGENPLPGAPGCIAAVAALEAVAAAAIERAGLDPAPDVDPFTWALYTSRQMRDADEIRLAVNLRAPPGEDGPEQAARERALVQLRRALRGLGVFEGLWRPAAHGAGAAPV